MTQIEQTDKELERKSAINQSIYAGIDWLYKVTTAGEEHLDDTEPKIFISNQVSIADFRIVLNRLPKDTYVVASEEFIWQYPVMHKFQENMLIVKPGTSKSIKTILDVLKNGHSVLIYPEGSITKTGTLMAFQRGVSFFARKSNLRIQPIAIEGTERSPYSFHGKSGYTATKWLPNVKVTIGEAFSLPEETSKKRMEQMDLDNDFMYGKLNELLLSCHVREKRNLWNDLLKATEVYGKKKELIVEEDKHAYSYEDLIGAVQHLSKELGEIQSRQVGVFLPESLTAIAALFSLFKELKDVVVLPVEKAEQQRQCMELSNLKTIVTTRKFVHYVGLEELYAELEQTIEVIYLDDSPQQKTRRLKKVTPIEEGSEQLVVFFTKEQEQMKGIVFTHDQLYAGVRQNGLTVGRQMDDLLLSLMPYFSTLGLTFGMLFPLLNGMPFIATYLPPAPSYSEAVYTLLPTMLLASKRNLEDIWRHGDGQHLNFTRCIFTPFDEVDEAFQMKWVKKYRSLVYEGYYNEQLSTFFSLNTNNQYRYNTMGRIMPGNQVEGTALSSPAFSKGILERDGFVLQQGERAGTKEFEHPFIK